MKIRKLNNSAMVFKKKIRLEVIIRMRYWYHDENIKAKEIVKRYPEYSKTSIYRHCVKPIVVKCAETEKKAGNTGRPSKLTAPDKRHIIRTLHKLRNNEVLFTSKRIQTESSMLHVTNKTVRNFLNTSGYRYLQARKKALLSQDDVKK